MTRRSTTTTIPAYIARTQLGSLLKQVAQRKARFVITKSGKPAAVLIGASDFDDMVEELDPEFQKSLKIAANEYQAGQAISLRDYSRRGSFRFRSRSPVAICSQALSCAGPLHGSSHAELPA